MWLCVPALLRTVEAESQRQVFIESNLAGNAARARPFTAEPKGVPVPIGGRTDGLKDEVELAVVIAVIRK